MTDSENRSKSLVSLVVEEYLRLKEIKPSHKALSYLSKVEPDAIIYNKSEWDGYMERFQDDSYENGFDASSALKNYYIFLKKTSNKLEKHSERLKEYISRRHHSK